VGSLIARKTGLGVYINAGRENAVASTKAFTTQVTVLSLIALWFHHERDKESSKLVGSSNVNHRGREVDDLIEALQRLPISFGMARSQHPKCKKIAEYLEKKVRNFVLVLVLVQ